MASTTDGTAIGALVLAVGSYLVLPFVAAVIALYLANKARDNIDASNGALKGRGLITVTRILAWINIVLCLAVVAFIVVIVVAFSTSQT